jgi:hypothetical protein
MKIDEQTAKKLYSQSPDWFQEQLRNEHGEEFFTKRFFDDFKTFKDLCIAAGTTEEEFEEKWDPRVFDPSTIAFERLKICTKAYNQDWPFDTFNTEQTKWVPWFRVSSSGLGFGDASYLYDCSSTAVGSRLCFKDQEYAEPTGTFFIKLFEDFITAKY